MIRSDHPTRSAVALLALAAVVFSGSAIGTGHAQAQPAPTTPVTPLDPEAKPSSVSLESVQKQIEAVTANTELPDADRQRALDYLNQAQEHLKARATAIAAAQRDIDEQNGSPARVDELKKLRRELDQNLEPERVTGTAIEVEQKLGQLKSDANLAETAARDWAAKPADRTQKRLAFKEREGVLQRELAKVETDLAAAPPAGEATDVFNAWRASRQAFRESILAEQNAIVRRIARYDTTSEQMRLEAEYWPLKVADFKKQIVLAEKALEQKRAAEAVAAQREAKQAVRTAHPAVTELAETNEAIAKRLAVRRGQLSALTQAKQEEIKKVDDRTATIGKNHADMEEKLKIVGMADALGRDLIRERIELPHTGDLRHGIRKRNAEIAFLRQKTGPDDRERIRIEHDLDELVDEYLAKRTFPENEREAVEQEVRDLYSKRREYLGKLHEDYAAFLDSLKRLNIAEQDLVVTTDEYAKFLESQSRWVRSADPLTAEDVARTRDGILWLADLGKWRQVGIDLGESMYDRPFVSLLVLLVFVLLAVLREKLRRKLNEVGTIANRSYTAPYVLTLQALACTMAVALVWPLLVTFAGWQLWSAVESADFSRSVGVGLLTTGLVFATLEFTRQLFRRFGLADAHFHWKRELIKRSRTHLQWLAIFGLPCMFVVGLVAWDGDIDRWTSLGRVALIAELLLCSAFAHFVFRPVVAKQDSTAVAKPQRMARFLYFMVVGIPLAFALLTAGGYQYTIWRLFFQMLRTVWLVLAVSVGQAMIVRWLYFSRGRLALEQIRKRKAAEAELVAAAPAGPPQLSHGQAERADPTNPTPSPGAATKSTVKSPGSSSTGTSSLGTSSVATSTSASPNSALAKPVEQEIDLATVNAHTRQLLRTCVSLTILVGFWFIWYEEVPSFGGLDTAVWSNPVQISRTATDADGNETLQTTTELRSVTVSDILFAVIVVFVTLNFARNVPALLEVLVLQYLPMDAGARYAASTLARYALTVLGIVVAFAMIGIGWSKVQWLVAALSLGLGFGLQELFANFVCGLILLFERPIRVGDIVTVGETTGIATKIQIRATTIRDWDRKEFVVPNKELVTGRLLNWTLSDTTNRVIINIGVAYGSDTEKARQLLFDIIRADAEIMTDPAPMVTFEGFGDSTLNMVVRAYLPSLENRLETIHRLHTTINRRFAASGIEIAFPQRDIHVRSLTLPEELVRSGRPNASSHGNGNGNGNGHGPHPAKETAGATAHQN